MKKTYNLWTMQQDEILTPSVKSRCALRYNGHCSTLNTLLDLLRRPEKCPLPVVGCLCACFQQVEPVPVRKHLSPLPGWHRRSELQQTKECWRACRSAWYQYPFIDGLHKFITKGSCSWVKTHFLVYMYSMCVGKKWDGHLSCPLPMVSTCVFGGKYA